MEQKFDCTFQMVKIESKTKYNLLSRNCPYGINHYNKINDVEVINKVGSDDCIKCNYHLCIKEKYVCCSEIELI